MSLRNPPGHGEANPSGQAGGQKRWVISHLLSVPGSREQRRVSRHSFEECFDSLLRRTVDVKQEMAAQDEAGRRVIICEGDPREIYAKWPEMPPAAVIEPEILKFPEVAPPEVLRRIAKLPRAVPGRVGGGASFEVRLTIQGAPLKGASATVLFYSPPPWVFPWTWASSGGSGQIIQLTGTSNVTGHVRVTYDATRWFPVGLAVEPRDAAWGVVIDNPRAGQVFDLPPLLRQGPLGWWHHVVGTTQYSESRGEGVRIGVIDTGVGPHPYLSHVKGIGAFLDGGFLAGEAHARDARNHGTHVCGIIGARPVVGSGDYGGLTPGAELLAARVFKPEGGATQGDIANAIDALSIEHEVDLINLSLGGGASLLEQDAIAFALQHGTLCICAAGNQSGAPVSFPAAYPQCVAVSAIGLLGTAPEGTNAAMNRPLTPDRYTWNGLFMASFNNMGPQMAITAPGNGIVSTVPAHAESPTPYAELSGTSMAAPLVTATLAAILSKDEQYKRLPRDISRAAYARMMLAWNSISLGLNPMLQGQGLVRGRFPRG